MPVEQVFDILPLHGTIEPGESQTLQFSFYGHAFSERGAQAICDVDGGPKYRIDMKGQASLVEYEFDRLFIDFDQVVG